MHVLLDEDSHAVCRLSGPYLQLAVRLLLLIYLCPSAAAVACIISSHLFGKLSLHTPRSLGYYVF